MQPSGARALPALYDDPEYGKDDDLTFHMSMRGRPASSGEWKQRFPDASSDLLVQDAEIAKLRRKIFLDPELRSLMDAHQRLRKEWRNEAKEKCHQNLMNVQSKINEKKADEKSIREEEQNQLRILQQVSKWEEDTEVPPRMQSKPESLSEMEDPEYGMFARIMYFKKGEGGYTHESEPIEGRFPDQKIQLKLLLDGSERNPLTKPCSTNEYRYFHLPANNMAWIAVSTFYFLEPSR